IGPNIFSVGPVGAGNTAKAINNMMACVNSLAMMEGLVLGVKTGLDPSGISEVVKASSGGSKALERIPTALVPRNFAPGFKVQLMNKDLDTFTTVAKELHVPASFANVAQQYEQAALGARRPGNLRKGRPAVRAGGAGRRPGRPGHQRSGTDHRAAGRDASIQAGPDGPIEEHRMGPP